MAWLLLRVHVYPKLAIVLLFTVSAESARSAVTVLGVGDGVLENVQQYLGDQPDCDAGQDTVEGYAAELPATLRPSLEAFGYYSAETTTEILPRADDCWQVQVRIAAGAPVRVRDLSLNLAGDAESDPRLRALFDVFPLDPGDPMRHGLYQMFKDRVEVLARQRGYLDGGFTEQRLEVFVQDTAADIALTFDSGMRYRFGNVSFDTVALYDEVLEDFVPFDEGEPYNASRVSQLQRELSASGYFNQANVTADFDAAENGRIPIRVQTITDRPTSYSVGLGYSTDVGPRFRFFYNNARRNRAGHQVQAESLLSPVRQTTSFEYRVPADNPQRDWWSLRAGLAREDIDAGIGSAARFGIRRTSVEDAVTVTGFLDVLIEEDDMGPSNMSTEMLVPGASWARSYRDDLTRPREGHRVSVVLSAGLGSDVSLLQFDAQGKWITATPWEARILLRGRIGAVFEDGLFGRIPLSMRFFAGGDNSVRGYDYQSLGPRDIDDDLIGGNRLIEASVEYEHPLLENWSAAVFVDSGNAFIDSGLDTRTGAGIGARWFSPIGPVRIDVAWPVGVEDSSPRLHLSLGPDL